MARNRSPNRKKSFDIYKKHNGNITSKEIAKILNENEKNIEYWRSTDKWNENYNPKGGAPKGNKNAAGHGPPEKNQNARKEGWYSKYYPTKVRNIIKETEDAGGSPLEILWAQIVTQWANIVNAQEIMYVKDKNDTTKELKKISSGDKMETQEYEIQFAWDKQANLLNAQSRAMTTLSNLIKRYDEMIHTNWDIATEEQKLRVEKLKAQVDNPEFKHKKEIDSEKLKLEKERFEHQKQMDSSKLW